MNNKPLLIVNNLSQEFVSLSGKHTKVLEDINFTLHEKEIVGLIGKSGSGKSTILRILSALIPPTSGEVLYNGKPIDTPNEKLSMVFQSFAIFPWLTVQENIELGLEAKGLPQEEIRKKALRALNLIGLDGYEHNLPKEISGGMKQRVGLARALVVEPEILLMDEPFSALDILIGEVLKTDLLDLWSHRATSLKSILLVTHNIEEAISLCDRVMVLSSHPGKIIAEIPITLPHPRDRLSKEFNDLMDCIYDFMTASLKSNVADINMIYGAEPVDMEGIMEVLLSPPYNGNADLPQLVKSSNISSDNLFTLLGALQLLQFIELKKGDIHVTAAGRVYAEGDSEERRTIFGRHLVQYVPIVSRMRRLLRETKKAVTKDDLFEELRNKYTRQEALKVLQTITVWGRYGNLFVYDADEEEFNLGALK